MTKREVNEMIADRLVQRAIDYTYRTDEYVISRTMVQEGIQELADKHNYKISERVVLDLLRKRIQDWCGRSTLPGWQWLDQHRVTRKRKHGVHK